VVAFLSLGLGGSLIFGFFFLSANSWLPLSLQLKHNESDTSLSICSVHIEMHKIIFRMHQLNPKANFTEGYLALFKMGTLGAKLSFNKPYVRG
jgi:hypothetical protein